MYFLIYYAINILPFDATGHRYELPTVSVNEPYSLCRMLVSNVYLVTTSKVRCSVVVVVIIIIDVVLLLLFLLLCYYYYQHHFVSFFLPRRL